MYGHIKRSQCKDEPAWTSTLNKTVEYPRCFYWDTLTAASTGYCEIFPHNQAEKWFSVVSMVIGIGFFFAQILEYIDSAISNADAKRAKYTPRIEVCISFIKIYLEIVTANKASLYSRSINKYFANLYLSFENQKKPLKKGKIELYFI